MALLWILYPVLVHSAVLSDSAWLEIAAISLLLVLSLIVPLRAGRLWAWSVVLGGIAASSWFCLSGWGIYFLYFPPLLINGFLAAVFIHSLQPGRRAVISVVAEKIRRETLPPPLERYTRKMTIFWAALFISMGLGGVLLALFAGEQIWSLFTNLICYLIVGLVFVCEFGLRRLWFPQFHHVSLREYLRGLVQADFRRL